jgi:putative membrane protein
MKTKIVTIILLTVLLIIFVLQNSEMVIINLFFWDISIPRALLIFVCFAMGLVIGLLIPSSQQKRATETEE